MKAHFIILMIFVLGLFHATFAMDSATKAEQFYKDGNYEAALATYDSMLKQHPINAKLLYNAGNTAYKLDQIGRAILYYERAAKFSPKDKYIEDNLNLAQLRTSDKIEATPGFFIVTWWNDLAKSASIHGWTLMALFSIWTALFLFMLYLFYNRLFVKKLSFYSGAILLIFALIFAGFRSQSLSNLNSHNSAILLQSSISVKSEPVNGSTDLFIIHEGIKFEVLDESGTWSKIRLADEKEGWVKSDAFERI